MRTIQYFISIGFVVFLSACDPANKLSVADIQNLEKDLIQENNRARVLHDEGKNLGNESKCDLAWEKYKEAISIRKALLPKMAQAHDSIKSEILLGIYKSLQNQSNCYFDIGNYHKSYELQQQSMRFLDSLNQYNQVFDWEIERRITACHYMARVLQELGNMDESIRNYQTAHTLCVGNQEDRYAERCRDMYITYGNLYSNWQEPDSIIRYSELAIATGYTDFESYKPYINCGIGYALKKQYAKALEQYDSALAKNPGKDFAKDRHNRALLYLENFEYSKAMGHILEAIAINTTLSKNSYSRKKDLAENYSLKGDILREKKEYAAAIAAYDLALPILTTIPLSDLNPTVLKNISIDKFHSNKISVLEVIFGKASTLLAQKKHEEALPYYDAAIHLTNRFRQSFSDQSSKIKLAALTKKIFEGAIEVCLALSKEEEAFAYAEQSKSFALLESVLQLKAMKRLPDIDPELQEAWNEARTEINRLNKSVNEAGDSMALMLALRQQISAQQIKLDSIEQEFQKNEAYVKLTTALNPPDVSAIQNNLLEDNQALAEYFIGEKQSYLFYIPKHGNLKIFPLNMDRETLAQKTDSLLFAIRLPHADTSGIKDRGIRSFYGSPDMEARCEKLYAIYAHELYTGLLGMLGAAGMPKRLLVIPDDVLGYLPFDALLTGKPTQPGAYADYPYLWKSPCYISYCYSGALLKEMKDHEHRNSKNKMLAFGHPERGFKAQIQALTALFSNPWSFIFGNFKTVRTKSGLKSKAKQAAFLHFSTHGHVDDRNPNYSYLDMRAEGETSTENNRLHLYDIYGLEAENTAMVVTSACETGFGRLYRGEGIISLARGFSAAGASSIITTLWSVYQVESGEIFTDFYKNLQDGKTTKDEALAKAKASFFEGKDHSEVAPYYWAGIVPVGEMAPVALPRKSDGTSALLITGLAISLIVMGLFLKKSFKRK